MGCGISSSWPRRPRPVVLSVGVNDPRCAVGVAGTGVLLPIGTTVAGVVVRAGAGTGVMVAATAAVTRSGAA